MLSPTKNQKSSRTGTSVGSSKRAPSRVRSREQSNSAVRKTEEEDNGTSDKRKARDSSRARPRDGTGELKSRAKSRPREREGRYVKASASMPLSSDKNGRKHTKAPSKSKSCRSGSHTSTAESENNQLRKSSHRPRNNGSGNRMDAVVEESTPSTPRKSHSSSRKSSRHKSDGKEEGSPIDSSKHRSSRHRRSEPKDRHHDNPSSPTKSSRSSPRKHRKSPSKRSPSSKSRRHAQSRLPDAVYQFSSDDDEDDDDDDHYMDDTNSVIQFDPLQASMTQSGVFHVEQAVQSSVMFPELNGSNGGDSDNDGDDGNGYDGGASMVSIAEFKDPIGDAQRLQPRQPVAAPIFSFLDSDVDDYSDGNGCETAPLPPTTPTSVSRKTSGDKASGGFDKVEEFPSPVFDSKGSPPDSKLAKTCPCPSVSGDEDEPKAKPSRSRSKQDLTSLLSLAGSERRIKNLPSLSGSEKDARTLPSLSGSEADKLPSVSGSEGGVLSPSESERGSTAYFPPPSPSFQQLLYPSTEHPEVKDTLGSAFESTSSNHGPSGDELMLDEPKSKRRGKNGKKKATGKNKSHKKGKHTVHSADCEDGTDLSEVDTDSTIKRRRRPKKFFANPMEPRNPDTNASSIAMKFGDPGSDEDDSPPCDDVFGNANKVTAYESEVDVSPRQRVKKVLAFGKYFGKKKRNKQDKEGGAATDYESDASSSTTASSLRRTFRLGKRHAQLLGDEDSDEDDNPL